MATKKFTFTVSGELELTESDIPIPPDPPVQTGRPWAFIINEGGEPGNWAKVCDGWSLQPMDGLHTQTSMDASYWFGDAKTWTPQPARFMMSNQYTAPSNFSMATASTGGYDSMWHNWLSQHAHSNICVVRIWQEINAPWFPWGQGPKDQIIAAWRRMATQVRNVFPKALIEWNLNYGAPQGGAGDGSGFDLYPGDDLVDVIGLDTYEKHVSWVDLQTCAGVNIENLEAFAEGHNKLIAISETAASGCDGSYLTSMCNWMDYLGERAAYLSYYDQGLSNNGDNVIHSISGTDACPANTLRAALNASSFRLPYIGKL